MKVKVCGITNYEDGAYAAECGADALGFIFYKKSKRYVTPAKVKAIIDQLPYFICKVGVFVNEEPEYINEILKEIGLNAVQLHGDEKPDLVDKITLPVIKSFRVNEQFDFSLLEKYNDCTFLLDTYSEREFGGTGSKFNWEFIPDEIKSKIILAGGISDENIDVAVNEINPAAVDLSSSLEKSPGIKDHKKIKQFFNKLKNL
ncbi:MAG: phosphoribosylanthranilate isomerase [Ignavibacteriae bacterium]|nr:phosphoribosylanthranilate isomerase [Ignavibacteriota bacterium]NOG97445.1 phosphoribosylanthranilate isomerase [Ignavibacteriota bacterium]